MCFPYADELQCCTLMKFYLPTLEEDLACRPKPTLEVYFACRPKPTLEESKQLFFSQLSFVVLETSCEGYQLAKYQK